jgi:hypothetical protein
MVEAYPAEPEPSLLVYAVPAPPPVRVEVTVREAPEAAPGFARAAVLRPDGAGGFLRTEYTVSSEACCPELRLESVDTDGEENPR